MSQSVEGLQALDIIINRLPPFRAFQVDLADGIVVRIHPPMFATDGGLVGIAGVNLSFGDENAQKEIPNPNHSLAQRLLISQDGTRIVEQLQI